MHEDFAKIDFNVLMFVERVQPDVELYIAKLAHWKCSLPLAAWAVPAWGAY